MNIIGVIPAAGYGTRLQPLNCSKEVYPVHGRPVMDYLIERMRAVSPTDIRVVTRPEKTDVAENARRHGATVVEARPATLADSFATGIGDADPADVILLGYPDSIWQPVDGYVAVIRLLDQGFEAALGLFRPREADLPRYETVIADGAGVVREIEFKPKFPRSPWIWGCAAARATALQGLKAQVEPGLYFDAMARRGLVGSIVLSDSYVDMGTHDGLAHALEAGPG